MLRITDIKTGTDIKEGELKTKAASLLGISPKNISHFRILRRSLDARKKPELFYITTVEVETRCDIPARIFKKNKNITVSDLKPYQLPDGGEEKLKERPVVIGSGPSGLFAAYLLALKGYRPIILERGDEAGKRTEMVRNFWKGGQLDPESNVQFGEGGAGTFSDGKLNTSSKDPAGRKQFILETFVRHGGPDHILYDQKPHLGTDILTHILISMRKEIEELGATYLFRHKVTDILTDSFGHLTGLEINGREILKTRTAILAIGHSSRDTYERLSLRALKMEQKAFAVGLRIQHPQTMIDLSQYGRERGDLPPAAYTLTHQTGEGRGVYSFCMCPGGYVVDASSEEERLCVNGMSYSDRSGECANSAIVMTVGPEDYQSFARPDYPGELTGLLFQREMEKRAYQAGDGRIPLQLFEDFREARTSGSFGDFGPAIRGRYILSRLDDLISGEMKGALTEGIEAFGHRIRGFDRPDAILAGFESRTSSPVRIPRNDRFESSVEGLLPVGEGAGYAGGIMSAAMDGMKAAEALIFTFAPLSDKMQGM